jgi:hypothetical protein
MQSRMSRVPAWARVDETSVYAICPACELFLPDEGSSREKGCPRCLRERGQAVVMGPVVADAAMGPGRAA